MGGSPAYPAGVAAAAFLLWLLFADTVDVFCLKQTATPKPSSTSAAVHKKSSPSDDDHQKKKTDATKSVTTSLRLSQGLQEAYHYIKLYNVNPWDVVNGLKRGNLDPERVYKSLILIRQMEKSRETLNALWVLHVKPGQLYKVLREMDIGPQYAYYALKVWWERPALLANYSRHGAEARPPSSTPLYVEQLLRKHFASVEKLDYWKSFHRQAYEYLKRVYPTGRLKEIDPDLHKRYLTKDKKAILDLAEINNISMSSSDIVPLSREPTTSEEASQQKKFDAIMRNITIAEQKKAKLRNKMIQRNLAKMKRQEKTKDKDKNKGKTKGRKAKRQKGGGGPPKKSKKYMRKKDKLKEKRMRHQPKGKKKGRKKRHLLESNGEVYRTLSLSSRQVVAWTDMPHSLQVSEDSIPSSDSTEFSSRLYNTGKSTKKSKPNNKPFSLDIDLN